MILERVNLAWFALASAALIGCGGSSQSSFSGKLDTVDQMVSEEGFAPSFEAESLSQTSASSSDLPADSDSEDSTAADASNPTPAIQRKIIYTSQLSLVVEDYEPFENQLPELVERLGGFISNSDTNRRARNQQSGTWTVRIPVQNYSALLSGVTGMGFAESLKEDAKDVTDEFVDVEARLRNNKRLEERILKMLDERAGKLSDVLEIERELARVREESERMEGRLRLLADRSSLATIVISVREEREFVPPATPTFGNRIASTWEDSLESLTNVARGLILVAVMLAPWLGVIGVPAGLVALIWRRRRS